MIKKKSPDSRSDDLSSREKSRLAVAAALDKKAHDLSLLDVKALSSFCVYFLICSCRSDRLRCSSARRCASARSRSSSSCFSCRTRSRSMSTS